MSINKSRLEIFIQSYVSQHIYNMLPSQNKNLSQMDALLDKKIANCDCRVIAPRSASSDVKAFATILSATRDASALAAAKEVIKEALYGCCYSIKLTTFMGTDTVGYPVGVFNVNDVLVGEADDSSEYVTLWNSDTANQTAGKVTATEDPFVFNYVPAASSITKLKAMRFFKYDVPFLRADTITVPDGSYVDFGNGYGRSFINGVTAPYTDGLFSYDDSFNANTFVEYFTGNGNPDPQAVAHQTGINLGIKQHNFGMNYPEGTPSTFYTVTVYHSDNQFYWFNDNKIGAPYSNAVINNLRGNMPKGFQAIRWTHVRNATMLTFANTTNKNEWKNNFKSVILYGNGTDSGLVNPAFNLAELINIESIAITGNYESGAPGHSVKLDTLMGSTDIRVFTKLKSLAFSNYEAVQTSNYAFPNFRSLRFLNYNGTTALFPATWVDQYLIDLDSMKTDTGGSLSFIGCERTAASTAAYDSLVAKGVIIRVPITLI